MPYSHSENGIKTAKADLAANAAVQSLVPLVAGKKIRIVALDLSPAAGCTVVFHSGPIGSSTAISHTITMDAAGGRVWPLARDGYLETATGEMLGALVTGGGCGFLVRYREV